MNINKLRVDADKANTGVWVTWVEDIEVLIARMGNTAFKDKVRKLSTAYGNHLEDPEVQQKLAIKAAPGTIVLDWRGITDDDDNPVEYSDDQCFEYLNDPELARFVDWVMVQANSTDNFAPDPDPGNSQTSSTGT